MSLPKLKELEARAKFTVRNTRTEMARALLFAVEHMASLADGYTKEDILEELDGLVNDSFNPKAAKSKAHDKKPEPAEETIELPAEPIKKAKKKATKKKK